MMGTPIDTRKSPRVHVIGLIIGLALSWAILSLIINDPYEPVMTWQFLLLLVIGIGIYGAFVFVYPFLWILFEPIIYDIQWSLDNRFGKVKTVSGNLVDFKLQEGRKAFLSIRPPTGAVGINLVITCRGTFKNVTQAMIQQGLSVGKSYDFTVKGHRVIKFA